MKKQIHHIMVASLILLAVSWLPHGTADGSEVTGTLSTGGEDGSAGEAGVTQNDAQYQQYLSTVEQNQVAEVNQSGMSTSPQPTPSTANGQQRNPNFSIASILIAAVIAGGGTLLVQRAIAARNTQNAQKNIPQ